LNNLSFRYAEDAPWVLKDCSLQIKAGEFIGLTGLAGSGKSTLLRLLMGYEDPTEGSISWNGQDSRKIAPHSLRQQVGAVWQKPVIPAGNLWQAIVGESGIDEEEAWRAAEFAGIAPEIRSLPMQMRTMVAEGGRNFSYGQRQRLLLARALSRRPHVLLLDDPTSALDARTRASVLASLSSLAATRLVISRHPTVLSQTNRIFFLKDGRICESGTYRELIALRANFFELIGQSSI
jgi:ABC-type bacteriocin/lantibiotic exporter with double-glycine peptidase domain